MDLDLLRDDVKFLKLRYGLDAKGKSEGRLVIRYVHMPNSPSQLSHPHPARTGTNAPRRSTRPTSSRR